MAKKKSSPPNSEGTSSSTTAKSTKDKGSSMAKDKNSAAAKYLPDELIDDLVHESPGINRTASLYSKTDLNKTMMDFLQELLPMVGFEEDLFLQDVRIGMCLLAIGIATYCIVMLKFPADSQSVLNCVGGYFFVAFLVVVLDSYCIGGDVFAMLKVKDGRQSINCSLLMMDFDDKVEWEFRTTKSWAHFRGFGIPGKEEPTKMTMSVARYFDAEGYLVVENLFNDFCKGFVEHVGDLDTLEKAGVVSGKKEGKKKK